MNQWWNRLPIFFSLFGFIGCLLLIALCWGLDKILLRKNKRYYDHE
jgi:hypothetical protein